MSFGGGGGAFGQTSAPASTSTLGTGLFGSTTAGQAASGGGGLFGTQPSTTTGFVGSSLGSAFGQTATSTQPSIFGSTTQATSSLGGGLFGTSSTQQTSAFGTGTGALGLGLQTTQPQQQTQQPSLGGFGGFGSGTATTGGFGSGLTLGALTTQQPSGFGNGAGIAAGLGSGLTLGTQNQPLIQQQIAALTNSPYGVSGSSGAAGLLRSSIQDLKEDIFKPVSPQAQRAYIAEATSPQKVASPLTGGGGGGGGGGSAGDFKGGLSQPVRITPKPLAQISLNKKQDLFEGLEDEETPCFLPRKNIKKLLFKPQQPSQQQLLQNENNTSRRVRQDFIYY